MPRIILVMGPTASGKTSKAIELAQEMGTEIVSCDSRQFYSELDIGVARPSAEELAAAKHHFIANRSVHNPYNVFTYEQEAMSCLNTLFNLHDTVVVVGGSGLYIDALSKGISFLPDPTPELRQELQRKLKEEGVESLRAMLKVMDPEYYAKVDLANGVRIQRALEVCITSGRTYTEMISQPMPKRPFEIEPVMIDRSREVLRERINLRVDMMMSQGLENEARQVYPLRHLTPLNTVGYKEFFSIWETMGAPQLLSAKQQQQVADAIKLNTWRYAKKQLTWLKKRMSDFKAQSNTSNL